MEHSVCVLLEDHIIYLDVSQKELKGFQNCGNYFMASFDIKSLFTNVPLDETINIVADSLYSADMAYIVVFGLISEKKCCFTT